MEAVTSNNSRIIEGLAHSENPLFEQIGTILLAQADVIEAARERCREADNNLVTEQIKLRAMVKSVEQQGLWGRLEGNIQGPVLRAQPSTTSVRDY